MIQNCPICLDKEKQLRRGYPFAIAMGVLSVFLLGMLVGILIYAGGRVDQRNETQSVQLGK